MSDKTVEIMLVQYHQHFKPFLTVVIITRLCGNDSWKQGRQLKKLAWAGRPRSLDRWL